MLKNTWMWFAAELSVMWNDSVNPVAGKVLAFLIALTTCLGVFVVAMILYAIATNGIAIAVTAAVIVVPSILIALALKSTSKLPSSSSIAEDP